MRAKIGLDITEQDFSLNREPQQEFLSNEHSFPKRSGCKISPSKTEPLSEIHREYEDAENKALYLKNLLKKEGVDKDEILENVKVTGHGTLIHNLQYFTDLFVRTNELGRLPDVNDFKSSFPTKDENFYLSMMKILEKMPKHLICNDPKVNAVSFWDIWRRNGQEYMPERHKNYVITPEEVKAIWEDIPDQKGKRKPTIPKAEIDQYLANYQKDEDIKNSYVINEPFILQNIYFADINMQVPIYMDKIIIPREEDFKKGKKIEVIDYKTGKEFKEPTFREKLQIFLMCIATNTIIMDKVRDINFQEISPWEITLPDHKPSEELPCFKDVDLMKSLRTSIHTKHIVEMVQYIDRNVSFRYIDPLTQDKIDVPLDTVFLKNPDETKNILYYLYNIAHFYNDHKKILSTLLSSNRRPYTLPHFPREGFLEDKDPTLQDSVQISFGI